MRNIILIAATFTLMPLIAWAQQRSFDEFTNEPSKYLETQVVVGCQSAKRANLGGKQYGDNVLFEIYTMGRSKTSWGYALVPQAEAESFYRKYSSDYTEDTFRTRPLSGVLKKGGHYYYLSYKGAVLPPEEADSEQEQDASTSTITEENSKIPIFDSSPMSSFSFGGKRLAEPRIVSVDVSGVKVVDKNNRETIIVPLERAVKIPELRIRAKDTMEVLLKNQKQALDNSQ